MRFFWGAKTVCLEQLESSGWPYCTNRGEQVIENRVRETQASNLNSILTKNFSCVVRRTAKKATVLQGLALNGVNEPGISVEIKRK